MTAPTRGDAPAPEPSRAGHVLRLERRFAAPRSVVWAAWTDPAALVAWFSPGFVDTRAVELDLRPGGGYRFEMRAPMTGETFFVDGEIREVEPPRRLVMTWRPGAHEPGSEICETLVTVELADRGLECDLTLTQELFPSRAARDEHRAGWEYCLEQLAAFLHAALLSG